MRYVAYYSNGQIYTGGAGWSLAKTTERAERIAGMLSQRPRVIAVIGIR